MHIAYIDEKSFSMVKDWEAKFQDSKLFESGVYFVGVVAVPVFGGEADTFVINVGVDRRLTHSAGVAVVESVLRDDPRRVAVTLKIHVFRGIPCRPVESTVDFES